MTANVPFYLRVPDGWLDYTMFGKPLENLPIIACKVPLKKERLITLKNQEDHFSPEILMEKVPNLGCIIDLTNTNAYYNSKIFTSNEITYQKIYCEGQEIPNSDVIKKFFRAMDSFLQAEESKGKFLMVHCTHGLNRTGYLLVRYLVERIGLKPLDAIKVFEKARGHQMTRLNYVQDLKSLIIGRGKMLLPKKNWWSETYLTWGKQDNLSGNATFHPAGVVRASQQVAGPSSQGSGPQSTQSVIKSSSKTFHPQAVPSLASKIIATSGIDVTKHNFQTVLKGLDEELSKASFISLDTKFTGSNDESLDGELQPLDAPVDRYQKIRDSTSKFMIIQVGLTLFYHNKKDRKWNYKSYNFYVFPNFGQFQNIRGFPDYTLQTSSISFLSNKDFDFNKLFKNGICFLNLSDEDSLKKGIKENLKLSDITNPTTPSAAIQVVAIPEEQRSWMKDNMAIIEEFLKSDDSKQKELILDTKMSALQRQLLFRHGKKIFPLASFVIKSKENGDRIIVISKLAKESKNNVQMWDELEKAVGFRRVFEKISNSGKLVVFHDSFLDIAHIIRQFYKELPGEYEDFKALARSAFPRLLDTKVMASSQPFREHLPDSALGQLVQELSKDPFKLGDISHMPGVPHYTLSQMKSNEAGYNSFITGLCFISMANYLETLGGNSDRAEITEFDCANAFTQKIFMMSPDIPYLCLDGPDMDPPRDNIFYMTFPKTWKLPDIQHLFIEYGPVDVNFNGDSAAFVTLLHKENKNLILENIHPPIGYVLQTYQSFKESSNSPGPSVEDDELKKPIHWKSSDSIGTSAKNGQRKKPSEKRSAEPALSAETSPASKKVRRIQNGNKESTVADPKTPLLEESKDWGSDSD